MTTDINLDIGAKDLSGLKKDLAKAQKLIDKQEEKQKKASLRQAKTTAKLKERIASSHSKRVHSLQIASINKTNAMDKRLSRKRAKNRLRQTKQRIREEHRLERMAVIRQNRIRARGRKVLGRGAMIGGGVAAGVAFGGIMAARNILEFDVALAKIAGQADVTIETQMRLKESITDASIAYGVSRDSILQTIGIIVDKSGRLSIAEANLEKFTKIIRGTKAEADDIGALFASAFNAFKDTQNELDPSQVGKYVEVLVAQGDKAQINIANLASESEKLFGAFKGAGLTTLTDFIDFGALIQASGEAGNAAEAATAAVRFLDQLVQKQSKLRSLGVEIFKPGTNEELKDISVILLDLMKKSGGRMSVLQKIFGIRAIKPLKILGAEFKSTGKIESFMRSLQIGRDAGGATERKFERVAATASQGFERLMAVMVKLSDVVLVDTLNHISNAINKLADNPEKLKQLENTMKEIGNTLLIAAKVGSIAMRPFGALLESADIQKRVNKLPLRENLKARMQGTFFKIGGARRRQVKRNLEGMEIKVETNVVMDQSTGNIKQQDQILEVQSNRDRGE